ncbi:MAG: OadG family protein [Burkholderiales bacterium]|jgi:sodium pump decarboxylase gamma subunit|nr:OadG family protein [Burkholderiales bacterium]
MNNLAWGLQMTALGMGLVFGLLALLWALLTLVLKFDREPAAVEETAESLANTPPPVPAGMDSALVAAIVAAVLQHKAQARREAAPTARTTWPGSQLYASRWVAAGRARQTRAWTRGR